MYPFKSYKLLLIALLSVTLTLACSSRIVYQSNSSANAQGLNAVNINTATVQELEKLPGIGHKTAEAIVQFRTENGPYRRIENLLQIRGISEKRFFELHQYIRAE